MDEVRVSETRDLCWSESHSSQKPRRGKVFRTTDQDQSGEVVPCQEDPRVRSLHTNTPTGCWRHGASQLWGTSQALPLLEWVTLGRRA